MSNSEQMSRTESPAKARAAQKQTGAGRAAAAGTDAITPVLMCGGSGTRLWPLSRKSYPKQFAALIGDETMFQAAARRVSGVGFQAPLVVTHSDFRFIVVEQLATADVTPSAILIEPQSRNTAPAILAAALRIEQVSPGGLMLIMPSDHVVPDRDAFVRAVDAGRAAALSGKLVTFGVVPTRAETGYGYIEPADGASDGIGPRDIARFIEKPCAARAAEMVGDGRFLWNTGIVLVSAAAVLATFRDHAPGLVAPVTAAVEKAKTDLDFIRLDPVEWQQAENISFDVAIMERTDNSAVIPLGSDWSDLGGWDAVWRASDPDERGVAVTGAATAIDCDMTLLRSEDPDLQLVGLGLQGVIAVAMPDAVLIADANRMQEVKAVVATLRGKGTKQATEFPKDHRPWGWFESLVTGGRFQVKRIVVHPGAALSLQSHHHRSEHWIVVAGTARVTVDDDVTLLTENQSVYIPLGATHRLENPGKLPMVLIEVQTGAYLGEDDIIRYEDVYSRC